MSVLVNDIKYAFRQLCKSPGFTAVAVISLALGIGAGTAIFSLVNGILLRSLPVPNPHELRVLQWAGTAPQIDTFHGSMFTNDDHRAKADAVAYPMFARLRRDCNDLADIFGYKRLNNVTVRVQREALVTMGAMVSDNFFSGLGVRPLLGRLLSSQDNDTGAAPVTVITHSWWQRHFDGDRGVLGRSILCNGRDFTVVGVLPRGFAGVQPADETPFYVPMSAQPQLEPTLPLTSTDHWWVMLMARLRPGTADAQFRAALDVVFTREAGAIMKDPKIVVEDGRRGPGGVRTYYHKPLLLLLGIVGVVLLVACANLAGLSLARGAARQREFAVRAAIGAGRWRLIRQSLTESLVVALLGGGLGVLLASWGKTAISQLLAGSPEGLRYDTSLDLAVLGFALATVLVTALLSGLLPALYVSCVDSFTALKERASLGSPRPRLGRLLVSAQIALSMLLVAGAGLYARTLVNLVTIDPGFETENLLLFRISAHNAGYRGARSVALYENIQRALAAIPGVRSAGLTRLALLGGSMSGGGFFSLPGHSLEGQLRRQAHRLTISETFFATMGIPLRRGRGLRVTDTEDAAKVVVVNETFARRYLPGEDPIGQTLRTDEWRGDGVDWQIVGVCADAKYRDIRDEAPPTVYFSFRQDFSAATYFAVRTSLPPLAVVTAARRAVAEIDPDIPLANIATQEQVRNGRISEERLFAFLCGTLALLALLLSCIGLYGLMAYNVARRTNEIGVRMALGATGRNVAAPVLREALLLAGIGVAIGIPAALALGRVIKGQLYGVKPSDPLTLIAGAALLVVIAITAACWPAHRAAKIDPMEALRYE
ncbi:MAG: ABC transporter permease [Phycisphaerales bacterium]|nr:MAG: ABC transporter permease [Phycisphaerales bacterium]